MSSDRPHFICIGASKSGTTWLHHQLMNHEDIWVPFVKEMHYFNHDNVDRWITKVFKNGAHGKRVRFAMVKGILRGEIRWTYRYLFKKLKHSTYKNLFPTGDLITGEVTPAYARMSEQKIERLAQLVPNCKLIYILRNPVDRTWSHLNMRRLNSTLRDSSPEEIFALLNSKQIQASKYLENLDKWYRHFDKQNIYIGFYDELREAPTDFLNGIYSFLEVKTLSTNAEALEQVKQVRNKGLYDSFPDSMKKELTERFYQDLVKIHERFDNQYTRKWVKEAGEIMAG